MFSQNALSASLDDLSYETGEILYYAETYIFLKLKLCATSHFLSIFALSQTKSWYFK